MSAATRSLGFMRRFFLGDARQRKYARYQLAMRLRGVDLRWASPEALGLDGERSYWHSNSGGPDLEKVLDSLPISPDDAILDVGCGMGGALLTMARYPFARVDGVEISPELARIARDNLSRLRIAKSEVFCSDAAAFTDIGRYNWFYFYNPFPAPVMQSVMENIAKSSRRQLSLIYKNPQAEPMVLAAGFKRTREFSHSDNPFILYIRSRQ